jgi:hypothetical protein
VTEAILQGGFAWEEKVIANRLKGRVKIADGSGPLHKRAHEIKESLSILKALKPNQAIYQPTLKVPETFGRRYGLDPRLCDFPACRPDLIHFTSDDAGNPRLRIVDIKASAALKESHRVQAAIYVLMVQDILEAQGLNLPLDVEKAGIWLFEKGEPEWFDLGLSISIVERFFSQRLPEILSKPLKEVRWHLFFRCEWCDFYPHCRKEAEEGRSVSLLPYLSPGARAYLAEAPWRQGKPVNTLDDLKTLLQDEAADVILDACGSLRGKGDRLRNAVQSLQTSRVVIHGGTSLSLPVFENVTIVMSLQNDPVSGQIYAAGFRRFKGKDVYGNGSNVKVFVARTPQECESVCQAFLKALFDELKTLHDHNEGKEWKDQKSLQTYVFDGYELTLFNKLLLDSLSDPSLASLALQMLFYFQDTSLADEDEHPTEEVPFPVIILTGVIRELVALPIPLYLRLPEAGKALPAPGFNFTIEPHELFWFELSNTLKSDAIFQSWTKGKKEAVKWVEDELSSRLIATNAILEGLREAVKDRLFAWPPKFRFPGVLDFKNPEFSRLAFVVRYESFMGAVDIREKRTRPWGERVREGLSIPLQKMGGDHWKVLSELDSSLLEPTDFLNHILVPHGEAGERAQMSYNDHRNRKSFWALPNEVRLAKITDRKTNSSGLITHLTLEVKSHKNQQPFQNGQKAVLHPRFTDFTSDRIVDRLGALDVRPENDFLKLLRNPFKFSSKESALAGLKPEAMKVARGNAVFTGSQLQAFKHILDRRLTLVWGPPGTGKTHFLAKTILCLAKAKEQNGKAFRIAVTAFTHAAIENLLAEIQDYARNFGLEKSLSLYKLKDVRTPRGRNLRALYETSLRNVLEDELLVVGGTVFSFSKAEVEGHFPIVIVDEASQMKFGELALGMAPLSEKGSLVLAGDDLQLPPILKGVYPEPEDGLPGLQDSIFAYLRARDDETNPYTFQLQENWRMNHTLSRFPAETLYGLDYRPANEGIGSQVIHLKGAQEKKDETNLLRWLLDPDWPLVVGILEDVQATVENKLEAELVAEIAVHLRENLRQAKGKPFPDTLEGDREFWRHGLFIVSPHHVQIRAIRRELSRLRQWYEPPFVDTVDKMQGQQSQNVIVSYGVSDVEAALAEAEFIYGLNRINVSISRARAKCVVFLPRRLLQPSFELLRNEKACKGVRHMHALLDFCNRYGEEKEFRLDSLETGAGGRFTGMRARFQSAHE